MSTRRRTSVALASVVVLCACAAGVVSAVRIGPDRPTSVERNALDVDADASTTSVSSSTPLTSIKGIGATRDRAIDPMAIERISWQPNAAVYRGFLTEEECDHLIALASPTLKASTVVDASTGGSMSSSIRTSSGMFLVKGEDEVVASIERRIASWTHVPMEHGEGFQVLRYELGQEYRPHYDYFHDDVNTQREKGGQRVATVLMYLSDVERGGETIFPDAKDGERATSSEATSCAAGKLAVKPKKGDALFFMSLYHNTTHDLSSNHGGCPVIQGVKYSATKWMHVAPIEDATSGVKFPPGVCKDVNPSCKAWAKSGECKKNPTFMVGRNQANGSCMRSCGACPPGTRDA